jgi:hypothetical protein
VITGLSFLQDNDYDPGLVVASVIVIVVSVIIIVSVVVIPWRFVIVNLCLVDFVVSFSFQFTYFLPSLFALQALVRFSGINPLLVIIFDILYLHIQPGWSIPVPVIWITAIRVSIWIE